MKKACRGDLNPLSVRCSRCRGHRTWLRGVGRRAGRGHRRGQLGLAQPRAALREPHGRVRRESLLAEREIGRGGITRPHARYMRDTTTLLYCIVPLKFI